MPILRPPAEDCIGVLLGQQRYEEELQREPGTWFLSPGWTGMGTDFVFRELQINRIGRKDIDPLQLARRMLEGFTRALYIDMDLDREGEDLAKKARRIARDLDLRLESTPGSCAFAPCQSGASTPKICELIFARTLRCGSEASSPE